MAAAFVCARPVVASFRRRPRVRFYGTSIEVGYNAADRATQGYPARLALLDFLVDVDAADGRTLVGDLTSLGAVETRVLTWADSSPDVVWLALGTNDAFGGQSLATFETRYGQLLDTLADVLPDAVIVAQTPLVRSGENGASPEPLSAFRTTIATLCAARPAVVLVNGPLLLSLDDMDDGTHPHTAGHALLANRIASILDAYR
jgi:lysophospholipase L1-like esterase